MGHKGLLTCMERLAYPHLLYPCSVTKELSQGPKVDAMQTHNLPFFKNMNIIFLSE